MLEKYKNKKVLIAGFGVEGRATFEFLKKHGIKADIADVVDEDAFFEANPGLKNEKVIFILGKKYLDLAKEYDVVFRAPGISPLTPELLSASQKGTEVTSQIKIFLDLCPAKTIGVTGTKGKGTTSSLIYGILKAGDKDAYLGGNIGVPAISLLDQLGKDSIVVLELSSFQLMDLKKSPNIAVVLNITQDHLDYHESREEYVEAKSPIVKYQTADDFAVINTDYETSREFKKEAKAKTYEVSIQNEVEKGCYVGKNNEIILRTKDTEEKIASLPELQLRGRHNLENVCPAVAVSYIAGVDLDAIKKAVREFKGLEHRLEFVAEVEGVKYYNDSFATTPETTIAAISAFHEPIILIAGGSEKGSDYTQMGTVIAEKVKTVFLIGGTAEEIKSKILCVNPSADIREGFTDMDELVSRASEAAKMGDVVVLSPGCASFGLFENYKQRGELFKKTVAGSRK